MDFVVLPSQALSDPKASPLFLVEDFERTGFDIEVIFGDCLEHLFRKHDMPGFPISFCGRCNRR